MLIRQIIKLQFIIAAYLVVVVVGAAAAVAAKTPIGNGEKSACNQFAWIN